ncbi:MAG: hypothetical protein H0T47_05260 [Planctomycetaceae bacterium]|nr:hypothetical protein [Planctomycetaceae bacterium]
MSEHHVFEDTSLLKGAKATTLKIVFRGIRDLPRGEEIARQVASSCLLSVAFTWSAPIVLSSEVPAKTQQVNTFRPKSHTAGGRVKLEMPSAQFRDEIIRYYQLALSSRVPSLQYLSFYHVLEYFFVEVTEGEIVARLLAEISNPAFVSGRRERVEKLLRIVDAAPSRTDEKQMLEEVLKKYVPMDELLDFIREYESHVGGSAYYTKERVRFGQSLRVLLDKQHIYGNVALIVKNMRNSLVHSSDHRERQERFVPFGDHDELIEMEIPLVRFLAEKVILGSARTLRYPVE